MYLLNKLGSCGRSPDRATAGTGPARASLPRFIEMIPGNAVATQCVGYYDTALYYVMQVKVVYYL